MSLTGSGRVAGIIGWPVTSSRSPRLHGYWLAHHGVDGAYVPMAVRPERLAAALRGLAALGFAGANVTRPHKESALALVDRVDPLARRIGAVNTLVIGADGGLEGRNTDGFGFLENLRHGAPGFAADQGPVVVLGAGGAARAVVVALIDAGAPEIRIVNRTIARTKALIRDLGGPCAALATGETGRALADAALLVNTTSLGMAGQPPFALDLTPLPATAVVTDIVYEPLETALLAAARRRGLTVVDGLGMLLHQARPGFAAWFGLTPAVTAELRAAVLGRIDSVAK